MPKKAKRELIKVLDKSTNFWTRLQVRLEVCKPLNCKPKVQKLDLLPKKLELSKPLSVWVQNCSIERDSKNAQLTAT